MSFLGKAGQWLANLLLPLGGIGLFGAALVDSSFLPLPEGVDLWLISLAILKPEKLPTYIVAATLGSIVGSCALYGVVRWSEDKYLESHPKNTRLRRVQRWLEKYETLALIVGAILPPPMPFKLVVISAALVKGRFNRFLAAVTVGRIVRYSGEGLLAVHYGRQAGQWILKVGPYLVAVVVIAALIYFFILRSGDTELTEE